MLVLYLLLACLLTATAATTIHYVALNLRGLVVVSLPFIAALVGLALIPDAFTLKLVIFYLSLAWVTVASVGFFFSETTTHWFLISKQIRN